MLVHIQNQFQICDILHRLSRWEDVLRCSDMARNASQYNKMTADFTERHGVSRNTET